MHAKNFLGRLAFSRDVGTVERDTQHFQRSGTPEMERSRVNSRVNNSVAPPNECRPQNRRAASLFRVELTPRFDFDDRFNYLQAPLRLPLSILRTGTSTSDSLVGFTNAYRVAQYRFYRRHAFYSSPLIFRRARRSAKLRCPVKSLLDDRYAVEGWRTISKRNNWRRCSDDHRLLPDGGERMRETYFTRPNI